MTAHAASRTDAPAEPTAVRPTKRRGKSAALTPAYRLEVASRALAAVLGGFLLASAVAMLVAVLLVLSGLQARGPAVVTGTLLSWLVWTGAALWAFHARSQRSAWAWVLAPAATAGVLAFLVGIGS